MYKRHYLITGNIMLVTVMALLSSCTTVTRGTKDTLVIESDPPGANITLSNGMTGKTPSSFKLPRKHPLVVKIEKEGYESVEVNVTPQISGAGGAGMAGNVLLGGIIGAAVDAGTGAMNDLKPNPIQINLVPLVGTEVASADIVAPATSEQKLKELESMLNQGLISQEEYETKRSKIINEI